MNANEVAEKHGWRAMDLDHRIEQANFEPGCYYLVEGVGFSFKGELIDPYSEDDYWDGEYFRFQSVFLGHSVFHEISVESFLSRVCSARLVLNGGSE